MFRSIMQPQPSGEKSVSVSYVERVVVVQPGETEAPGDGIGPALDV